MNYQNAIDWLYGTQLFGIKLGLENIRRLLRERTAFPDPGVKVIHVAGTNGKGSTCAMIDALARAAGHRSGLFTSPHLVDFRERIQVDGVMISEQEVADELTNLREIVADWEQHPTFFELTLAIAMRHFRSQGVSFIVLETGMGGRLDATNAIPKDVAVIAPVAMDHAEWLGDTLAKIATEKAGIIADGKPVVCAPQQAEALRVIEIQANEKRSPLVLVNAPLDGYGINLAGNHQRWNAALAVEAVFQAGIALRVDMVRHALGNVTWPGRFERRNITDDQGEPLTIILDATHNPHAAEALAETWREIYPTTKAVMVFGAAEKKDIAGVLDHLLPLAAEVITVPINSPRSSSPQELAEKISRHSTNPEVSCEQSVAAGIERARAAASRHDLPILITGSLFLLGEATALLDNRHHILHKSSQ